MSTVIKSGTIVTADRTYKADVLIEGEQIVAIGQNLHGRHGARRHRLLRHAGRHRSAHPSRNALHGHLLGRRLSRAAPRAALSGGTTMVVDFCLPGPNQSLLEALQMWDNKTGKAASDYSFHMAITWWGEQVFKEMAEVVEARHHHLQALHGLQGRADGQRRRDVSRRSSAAPSSARCRWSMPRTATSSPRLQQKLLAEGNTGPEAHAYSRPPEVEGEADQPRHHDRRHGRRAALCRARLLRAGARGDPPRPRRRACASMASR